MVGRERCEVRKNYCVIRGKTLEICVSSRCSRRGMKVIMERFGEGGGVYYTYIGVWLRHFRPLSTRAQGSITASNENKISSS
jgi:hypothetical protein